MPRRSIDGSGRLSVKGCHPLAATRESIPTFTANTPAAGLAVHRKHYRASYTQIRRCRDALHLRSSPVRDQGWLCWEGGVRFRAGWSLNMLDCDVSLACNHSFVVSPTVRWLQPLSPGRNVARHDDGYPMGMDGCVRSADHARAASPPCLYLLFSGCARSALCSAHMYGASRWGAALVCELNCPGILQLLPRLVASARRPSDSGPRIPLKKRIGN